MLSFAPTSARALFPADRVPAASCGARQGWPTRGQAQPQPDCAEFNTAKHRIQREVTRNFSLKIYLSLQDRGALVGSHDAVRFTSGALVAAGLRPQPDRSPGSGSRSEPGKAAATGEHRGTRRPTPRRHRCHRSRPEPALPLGGDPAGPRGRSRRDLGPGPGPSPGRSRRDPRPARRRPRSEHGPERGQRSLPAAQPRPHSHVWVPLEGVADVLHDPLHQHRHLLRRLGHVPAGGGGSASGAARPWRARGGAGARPAVPGGRGTRSFWRGIIALCDCYVGSRVALKDKHCVLSFS